MFRNRNHGAMCLLLCFLGAIMGCVPKSELTPDVVPGDHTAPDADFVGQSDPGADDGVGWTPPEPVGLPAPPTEVFTGEREVAVVVDSVALPVLKHMIERAENSVCVLAFEFVQSNTTSALEIALKKAADRGVDVRVLVDDTVDESAGFVARLIERGVDAKLDTAGTAHTKLLVSDGSFAMAGSTNWSHMSLKKNREVNLLIRDTAGVSAAESYCLSRHANPKILRDIESPKEGQVQLFGDGRIDQALHEATEQAEGRIDVVIYAINASPQFPTGAVMTFLDALGDAVDRGVEVRVVLEKSDFDFNLNSMNAQAKSILEARGVEVRYEEVDTITHAKLLVADDVAVVATGNWSYGGFVQNHELAIWVVEESAVSALRTYAQVLFNQSQ